MNQGNKSLNTHIEEYLDYYCELSHPPRFAVLLKGQWGAGKTWFINRYCDKLKDNNHKCLYVSLYGMTTFSEIEDTFFQQLHPVLSSKGMALTGKILKGIIKGTLKIDLNDDSKDDGTVNIQIPEINLPEYLKNTDKSILIFDDLERCKIDISNILGYINYFVEHQDLKVIIVANEDELFNQDNSKVNSITSYKNIKEKLIGKTFGIVADFHSALEDFISQATDSKVKTFLSKNSELIQDLYKKAEYENLRNLRQIILDFERIFEVLPETAKSKSEILRDLLKLLMAFSIEIKRGTMSPKDISKLQEEYMSLLKNQVRLHQAPDSVIHNNSEEQSSLQLQKILGQYIMLNLHDPFPSEKWWETFFDKGIIDRQELEQSLSNSKYFQDEKTPNWIRLWHFFNIDDDKFEILLKEVASEYADKKFLDLGILKHITGLFLKFSDVGLYCKSKEEIIKDAKLYINYLKINNQFTPIPPTIEDLCSGYGGLGFQGRELREFKEFSSYISEIQESVIVESMPSAAEELLSIMQSDVWKFYRMICRSNSQNEDISGQRYYEVPIFKYINPSAFIEKFLLMNYEDQSYVFSALTERYEFNSLNEKLVEELVWLKSVQSLLLEEASHREGKISGYCLELLNKNYLNAAIEKLIKAGKL